MTTEERLETLEKELGRAKHRNRWLLAGAALVLGAVGLVAWAFGSGTTLAQPAGDVPKEVRAGAFVLVDENAKMRAVLSMTGKGPGLALLDEKGKPRVVLVVDEDGPSLFLYDENGKVRADLTATKLGASLGLTAEKGNPSATLAVTKYGPGLSLTDEKGNPRAVVSVTNDGPWVALYDENSHSRAALGTTQTGTPDGKTVTYPESSLLLFGPDGKVIWQAP